MQININKPDFKTNFKAAYIVDSANIGKYFYNYRQKDIVHRVADALGKNMYEKTLSDEMKNKVNFFFPDYKNNPFVRVARTGNCHISRQIIVIMTAYEADTYNNARIVERNTNDDNTNSQAILKKIAEMAWHNRIHISAEEKDGRLNITDIKRVEK